MTSHNPPPSNNGHHHQGNSDDDGRRHFAPRWSWDALPPLPEDATDAHAASPVPSARRLTQQEFETLRMLLALGVSRAQAALYVGIHEVDLTRLIGANPALSLALAQAQVTAELQPLHQLATAAERHWQAAAWKLERTRPNDYARRKPKVLAPAHVAHLLRRLLDILFAHVPEAERRARIEADLRKLYEGMLAWGNEESR